MILCHQILQTMLVAHDTFATFDYSFGDMDALTLTLE